MLALVPLAADPLTGALDSVMTQTALSVLRKLFRNHVAYGAHRGGDVLAALFRVLGPRTFPVSLPVCLGPPPQGQSHARGTFTPGGPAGNVAGNGSKLHIFPVPLANHKDSGWSPPRE